MINSRIGAVVDINRINSISNMRTMVNRLQNELTTGRREDIAGNFGSAANLSYALRTELRMIEVHQNNTSIAQSELSTTENALAHIRNVALQFKETLIAAKTGSVELDLLREKAGNALNDLILSASVEFDNKYILSGQNTDQAPIHQYAGSPPSIPELGFRDAFLSSTGAAYEPVNLATLSSLDVDQFVNFYAPDGIEVNEWRNNWLAGDSSIRSIRIDDGRMLDMPSVDNESAMRKLAAAYTIVSKLAYEELPDEGRVVFLEKAISMISEGEHETVLWGAQVGASLRELSTHTDLLTVKRDHLSAELQRFESVDRYEASMRLNNLQVNLELAYTLTSRLQNLFLANYI